jgi:ABC-type nitrate/sulfonate/bicarbonate transport system substrate-binding protein
MRASALACVVLLGLACGPIGTLPATGPSPAPDAVTFMAGFKPQANLPFVAVYVAQEHGYFRAQNLEVAIEHSAGQGEHVRLLGTGRIHFSTGSAQDVLKRVADADVPLVSIALIGQRGEQAFAVRRDSGVGGPKDWEGRLVGYKGVPSADYLALLRAAGVDRAKVREVSVGFDPRVLVARQVDVYPVFISNEPYTLQRLGVPVRLFEARDFGVPTLGLTFITNREMVDGRPDVVRRFLRAALRGLNDALADREGALDAVMKYAAAEDREHMRFMLEAELRNARNELTDRNGLGWMTREQWDALQRVLVEVGSQTRSVDVDAVQTDRFLRELYRDGRLLWP